MDPKSMPLFQIKENIWNATPAMSFIRGTWSYKNSKVITLHASLARSTLTGGCLHLRYTHIMSTQKG